MASYFALCFTLKVPSIAKKKKKKKKKKAALRHRSQTLGGGGADVKSKKSWQFFGPLLSDLKKIQESPFLT